ncbi:MAG: glycosyltransferase [Candidatus Rokubacteria bacterium]|nr:glycosyltransferase [Candidatus Rokubacteria bacterium]
MRGRTRGTRGAARASDSFTGSELPPSPRSGVVLHTEASTGFGGQEIRIVAESRWLRNHGWRPLIACQPGSPLQREAQAQALDVWALPMRRAVDVRAFLSLRRLMRRHAVALVHTHSSIDSWLGGLAARTLGLPIVRSRHVTIAIRRALVYRLADRVVASGERAADLVRASGIPPERVVGIPPGVDLERFHSGVSGRRVRDELGLEAPLVGLVANVRGSKGHGCFLEAAREVLGRRPDVRFLIVGAGVGFDDVRRTVHEMGLEREVLMLGFRRDIPEVLAALDVLALPSIKSEATSQVILQALAIGTPVVATTVGGSPEIVRDGVTGRLVPPADARALACAILDLLAEPDAARRMARAGQAIVRERWSMDAVMARTTAIYEELLASRSGRAGA